MNDYNMNRVYLDQNVLSDLRDRKLSESKNDTLLKLRSLCESNNTKIIYSFTHFDETYQINNEFYQDEHINLLSQFDAVYISSQQKIEEYITPHDAWIRYQNTEKNNETAGINEVVAINDLIQKKLSGLPIPETFFELNKFLKTALR